MIEENKAKGNFDIVFEKFAQMEEPKVSDLLNESSAINKLRETVLEVMEEDERYFSTT